MTWRALSPRPFPTSSADADAAAAATAVNLAVTTAAAGEAAAAAAHDAALLWRTRTCEAIDTAAWAAVTSVKTAAQARPGGTDIARVPSNFRLIADLVGQSTHHCPTFTATSPLSTAIISSLEYSTTSKHLIHFRKRGWATNTCRGRGGQ
jgi:hypothetical protein